MMDESPMNRTRHFSFALPALLASLSAFAAPPTTTPVADPPELQKLSDEYKETITPLQEKLEAAIKVRAQKYGSDLKALEAQVTGAGQTQSLEAIRIERDAYLAGRGAMGFSETDKIPSTIRDLRRNYDRDVTKMRTDAAPSARPFLEKYTKSLEDLERKFVSGRNADGVLATQQERRRIQTAAVDPLYGGDKALIGTWVGPEGGKLILREDGSVKTSGVSHGKWEWQDRAKRRFHVNMAQSWAKDVDLALTPDGWGIYGKDTAGKAWGLSRQE
jgi:hypothetical protein